MHRLAVLLLLALVLTSCQGSRARSVSYKVTGSAAAGSLSVLYLDGQGVKQGEYVSAPWQKTLTFPSAAQASIAVLSKTASAFGCELWDGERLVKQDQAGPGKLWAVCAGPAAE